VFSQHLAQAVNFFRQTANCPMAYAKCMVSFMAR